MAHTTFNYYRYTLNNGDFCSVKLGSTAAGATGCGWAAASAADPPAPYGLHPRVVYVLHVATGRKRAIPVATPAAFDTLLTGEHTVTLPELTDIDGEPWVVQNGREERKPRPHLMH